MMPWDHHGITNVVENITVECNIQSWSCFNGMTNKAMVLFWLDYGINVSMGIGLAYGTSRLQNTLLSN